MPRQIKITDELEFRGDAQEAANVKGNFALQRIMREWNYQELALDDTNQYTPYLDGTSSIALASGGITLTTAATDTKTCTQSQGGIWWYPAKNPVVEQTFQIDVITTVAIFAGFNDAVSEASSLLPFGLVTDTLTDTCSNGAGFLFDTRQTLNYFNVVNTKAATEGFTQLASTRVPVAATNLILRTEINSDGDATFIWNGVKVGVKTSAVTSTTPLIPFFGTRNNSDAAHVATLRRVRCWQDA